MVVGAGPAGIYASDLLLRNDEHDIHVDLFEQMPAPFGLIRYGVAPDHPRIKGIITAKTTDRIKVTTDAGVVTRITIAPISTADVIDAVARQVCEK